MKGFEDRSPSDKPKSHKITIAAWSEDGYYAFGENLNEISAVAPRHSAFTIYLVINPTAEPILAAGNPMVPIGTSYPYFDNLGGLFHHNTQQVIKLTPDGPIKLGGRKKKR